MSELLKNKMIRKLSARQKKVLGLTLLELVVTVSIFAILTLVITRLYMQVLNAQDRILDEQNIVAGVNYATTIFTDEARRATVQTAAAVGCGGVVSCSGKYFCSSANNDRACMMDYFLSPLINYYALNGIFTVVRGSAVYGLTSTNITVNSMILEATSTDGVLNDQLSVKAQISGANQYNQTIYYENYLTR